MVSGYENGFCGRLCGFLEERLGKTLFDLREKNADYRKLYDEYAALLNGKYRSVEEYRQAVSEIADIGQRLDDIEKHYLFLAGMREHAIMEDALSSDEFEKIFVP